MIIPKELSAGRLSNCWILFSRFQGQPRLHKCWNFYLGSGKPDLTLISSATSSPEHTGMQKKTWKPTHRSLIGGTNVLGELPYSCSARDSGFLSQEETCSSWMT